MGTDQTNWTKMDATDIITPFFFVDQPVSIEFTFPLPPFHVQHFFFWHIENNNFKKSGNETVVK